MPQLELAIGTRIRDCRKTAGLTQRQLGEHLGLSHVGLGDIERGKNQVNIAYLFKLSSILGRSVEYFLGIDNGLTAEEDEVLTRFRNIGDSVYRKAVLDTVRSFEESDREQRAGFGEPD